MKNWVDQSTFNAFWPQPKISELLGLFILWFLKHRIGNKLSLCSNDTCIVTRYLGILVHRLSQKAAGILGESRIASPPAWQQYEKFPCQWWERFEGKNGSWFEFASRIFKAFQDPNSERTKINSNRLLHCLDRPRIIFSKTFALPSISLKFVPDVGTFSLDFPQDFKKINFPIQNQYSPWVSDSPSETADETSEAERSSPSQKRTSRDNNRQLSAPLIELNVIPCTHPVCLCKFVTISLPLVDLSFPFIEKRNRASRTADRPIPPAGSSVHNGEAAINYWKTRRPIRFARSSLTIEMPLDETPFRSICQIQFSARLTAKTFG
jgi:hypothetical protein